MNLWTRVREGLTRTRDRISGQMGTLLGRAGLPDRETLERLEEALLAADVGPATTEWLLARALERMSREPGLDLRGALERCAAELLGRTRSTFAPGQDAPWIALLIGVNGVGKTTLAGKLAAAFARDGRRTVLVAADTFRAAAGEQLEVWAGRAAVDLVKANPGADPAAVAHDGVSAAIARGHQVVLVDTAGRLHTRHNLMEELAKVARVCARLVPGAPHHTLLVLDATLGQNGILQAREFQRQMGVTSLALNKLDGTARGGAVLAIAHDLGLPISVIGVGEGLDDWSPFDPEAFARGLFE